MARLDIVEPSMKAYKVVWAERQYLLRLAMVPLIIKFLCVSIMTLNGWETETIKHVFIMLPSYFADGWLFSHLVRLIYYGHRWPFRPTGNMEADMVTLAERARGVMAGTLTFVLIRYFADGFMGAMRSSALQAQEQAQAQQVPPEPGVAGIFIAIMMMVGLIWAFRLLWLYVPAALNLSMKRFLQDINRFVMSLYIIGLCLMSAVPIILVLNIVSGILFGGDSSDVGALGVMIVNLMLTVGDTAIWLVMTGAMAYGFLPFLSEKHRNQ